MSTLSFQVVNSQVTNPVTKIKLFEDTLEHSDICTQFIHEASYYAQEPEYFTFG